MREKRELISKAFRLQGQLDDYHKGTDSKVILKRFIELFGDHKGNHILNNYTSASELIWAMGDSDLKIFCDKF